MYIGYFIDLLKQSRPGKGNPVTELKAYTIVTEDYVLYLHSKSI